jgi:hypothetical protein
LECDGYDYEVSSAEGWVSGDEMEGYISLALGNMVYEDAEGVLQSPIDFLGKEGDKVTITIKQVLLI